MGDADDEAAVWDRQSGEAGGCKEMAEKPHPHALNKGYPLDSISVHIKTGQYYYGMGDELVSGLAVGNGFRKFFENPDLKMIRAELENLYN